MSICSNWPAKENYCIENLQNIKKNKLPLNLQQKFNQRKQSEKQYKSKIKTLQPIKIIQNYSFQEGSSLQQNRTSKEMQACPSSNFSQKQNLSKQNLRESFNSYYFSENSEVSQMSTIYSSLSGKKLSFYTENQSSQSKMDKSLTQKFSKHLYKYANICQEKIDSNQESRKISLIDQVIQNVKKNKKKAMQTLFQQRLQISSRRHQQKQFLKQKIKQIQKLKYEHESQLSQQDQNYQDILQMQGKVDKFAIATGQIM